MIQNWQTRTELLIGRENSEKLRDSHVLIVGLGGVGSYAAEQMCRAGIGRLTIADGDTIQHGNLNRQLPSLVSTLGKNKADVISERLLDINPELKLTVYNHYFSDNEMEQLVDNQYNYIIDAIDTLSPKIHLIYQSVQRIIPIVSSMGAGGKLDLSFIEVADISDSHHCKLALKLRKSLRKLGVSTGVKVVFSPELVPKEAVLLIENEQNKRSTVGSISYMPAVFGCYCASVVIRDLIESNDYK